MSVRTDIIIIIIMVTTFLTSGSKSLRVISLCIHHTQTYTVCTVCMRVFVCVIIFIYVTRFTFRRSHCTRWCITVLTVRHDERSEEVGVFLDTIFGQLVVLTDTSSRKELVAHMSVYEVMRACARVCVCLVFKYIYMYKRYPWSVQEKYTVVDRRKRGPNYYYE